MAITWNDVTAFRLGRHGIALNLQRLDDPRRHLEHGFGDHGVHLAGHDRAAWLVGGQTHFGQSGARAGAQQA